jgi:hypothetical protein
MATCGKYELFVKLLDCHRGASAYLPPCLSANGFAPSPYQCGCGPAGQHRQSCAKNGLDLPLMLR